MTDGDPTDGMADSIRRTLRSVLDGHPVSFAMVFGSAARGSMDDRSDVDVAVEFDDHRPGDDGYSDVYLRLVSDLDGALPTDVDVVDVHSMPPQFARVAFDDGDAIVGSDSRRRELEREMAGDSPSRSNAHARVAAAAERLREGSS